MASPEIVVTVESRPERAYVAVAGTVTISTIPAFYEHLADVEKWIASSNLTITGPPFMRYQRIDMYVSLDVELGFPVSSVDGVKVQGSTTPDGKAKYVFGKLPAGKYAYTSYVGHPSQMIAVNAALQAWERKQEPETKFDVKMGDNGELWKCRLEISVTNPEEEPDMSKWRKDLEYLLK